MKNDKPGRDLKESIKEEIESFFEEKRVLEEEAKELQEMLDEYDAFIVEVGRMQKNTLEEAELQEISPSFYGKKKWAQLADEPDEPEAAGKAEPGAITKAVGWAGEKMAQRAAKKAGKEAEKQSAAREKAKAKAGPDCGGAQREEELKLAAEKARSLWTKFKHFMSRNMVTGGSLEKGGKIIGREKIASQAGEQMRKIMKNTTNVTFQEFVKQIDNCYPDFPNMPDNDNFMEAIETIRMSYDSVKAAAAKYKPGVPPDKQPEGYLDPHSAQMVVQSMRKYVDHVLNYKLADTYKHLKENMEYCSEEEISEAQELIDKILLEVSEKDVAAAYGTEGEEWDTEDPDAETEGEEEGPLSGEYMAKGGVQKGLESHVLPTVLGMLGGSFTMGHFIAAAALKDAAKWFPLDAADRATFENDIEIGFEEGIGPELAAWEADPEGYMRAMAKRAGTEDWRDLAGNIDKIVNEDPRVNSPADIFRMWASSDPRHSEKDIINAIIAQETNYEWSKQGGHPSIWNRSGAITDKDYLKLADTVAEKHGLEPGAGSDLLGAVVGTGKPSGFPGGIKMEFTNPNGDLPPGSGGGATRGPYGMYPSPNQPNSAGLNPGSSESVNQLWKDFDAAAGANADKFANMSPEAYEAYASKKQSVNAIQGLLSLPNGTLIALATKTIVPIIVLVATRRFVVQAGGKAVAMAGLGVNPLLMYAGIAGIASGLGVAAARAKGRKSSRAKQLMDFQAYLKDIPVPEGLEVELCPDGITVKDVEKWPETNGCPPEDIKDPGTIMQPTIISLDNDRVKYWHSTAKQSGAIAKHAMKFKRIQDQVIIGRTSKETSDALDRALGGSKGSPGIEEQEFRGPVQTTALPKAAKGGKGSGRKNTGLPGGKHKSYDAIVKAAQYGERRVLPFFVIDASIYGDVAEVFATNAPKLKKVGENESLVKKIATVLLGTMVKNKKKVTAEETLKVIAAVYKGELGDAATSPAALELFKEIAIKFQAIGVVESDEFPETKPPPVPAGAGGEAPLSPEKKPGATPAGDPKQLELPLQESKTFDRWKKMAGILKG